VATVLVGRVFHRCLEMARLQHRLYLAEQLPTGDPSRGSFNADGRCRRAAAHSCIADCLGTTA
jgi:hypothetical protein